VHDLIAAVGAFFIYITNNAELLKGLDREFLNFINVNA